MAAEPPSPGSAAAAGAPSSVSAAAAWLPSPVSAAAAAAKIAGGPRVALCVSRFYEQLAERLVAGARGALSEAGAVEVRELSVPGAFELPLAAQYAARSGLFDAVVCLGAVIRGETDHYEHVCAGTTQGIMRVALDTGVPCGFGVLTVDTLEQALERVSGGSRRDTGRHAAQAVLAQLAIRDALRAAT